MEKKITPLQNAIYSLLLVALLLFSLAGEMDLAVIGTLFLVAYWKWNVLKYCEKPFRLDKLNFRLYLICGFLYSAMYLFKII